MTKQSEAYFIGEDWYLFIIEDLGCFEHFLPQCCVLLIDGVAYFFKLLPQDCMMVYHLLYELIILYKQLS
jgi:hypothetical protein